MSALQQPDEFPLSEDSVQWRDQEALAATKSKARTPCNARRFIELVLDRMGVDPSEPIEKGPLRETITEHLLMAAWESLCSTDRQTLYDQTSMVLHRVDRHGTLTTVSEKWCELLGYDAADVIGCRSVDFLTPESMRDAATNWLPLFWKQGWIDRVPYTFVHREGHPVDVFLSALAERDVDGQFCHSVAILIRR